jgi:hypothetical protein
MNLVRDRIPELAGNGQRATFHQADSEEFGRLLRDKLLEETAEAASAPGQPSCWRSSATSSKSSTPSPARPATARPRSSAPAPAPPAQPSSREDGRP